MAVSSISQHLNVASEPVLDTIHWHDLAYDHVAQTAPHVLHLPPDVLAASQVRMEEILAGLSLRVERHRSWLVCPPDHPNLIGKGEAAVVFKLGNFTGREGEDIPLVAKIVR